jgi:glycosyltransferase involved in cell wall biosynthesis
MEQQTNLLTPSATGGVTYGIDASSANKEKRTGVENYARHLIQAMKKHPLAQGERVFLYSPTVLDMELGEMPQGWSERLVKWSGKGWMKLRMSWEILRNKPTVLFVPAQGLPLICPKKVVTVIHDVAFKRRPDLYDPKVRKRLAKFTKRAIKKSTKIIVPSEATKLDLMELYKVTPERLVVIPEAADPVFRDYTQEEEAPVLRQYRLGTKIFLAVGRLEKKKNVTTLIRAFELFKSRRGLGDPYELVFAGEPGYGFGAIKQYLQNVKAKDAIKTLGYVPDEDLAKLMSAATGYVFPSWYEGFGIPNLEAMACGTPLITSDIPAHRELVGGAGLFASPNEPEEWAQAMERLVQGDGLADQLVEKGKQRVQEFSWEKTAGLTWEFLRTLV